MTTTTSSDIVMVPVPRQHFESVITFLAGRLEPAASMPTVHAPDGEDSEAIEVEGQGPWDMAMVMKLKRNLHLSAAYTLLDAAAAASPGEVSMRAVAREEDLEPNRLRAQMGALSKLSVKLFGRRTWPISVRYGDEPDVSGIAYYRMERRLADWWAGSS